MRHILPVGQPPMVSCLFHMHPLSILAQGDAYLPWLYSRCIQLHHHPGEALEMLVHPLSVSHQMDHAYRIACPLLDVQTVDMRAARQMSGDLIQAWVALITSGYYVQTDADHFYLTSKPEFGVRHLLGEVLLHGVDVGARAFVVRGFDASGRPGSYDLPFAELGRAMRDLSPEIFAEAIRGNGAEPHWLADRMVGRPRAFLFRYQPDCGAELDHLSVLEQLEDYLNARNSSRRYRLDGAAREGGVWGMAVYGWLRDALERMGREDVAFEPLAWNVLWEHKCCMAGRLHFLERVGTLQEAGLAAAYEEVAQMARRALLGLVRWAGGGGDDPEHVGVLLGRMAVLEHRLLCRVVQQLRVAA